MMAALLAVLAAGAVVASAIWFAQSDGDDAWPSRVALNEVPEGVTPWRHTGRRTGGFIVREGDAVALLSDVSPHLDGHVVWCESTGVFIDTMHGSLFDRRGYKLGGPAPRGLDRMGAFVDDGVVSFDPDAVQPGPPPDQMGEPPDDPLGELWACDEPSSAR